MRQESPSSYSTYTLQQALCKKDLVSLEEDFDTKHKAQQ